MPKLVHKAFKLQLVYYPQSHPLPEMNWLVCRRLTFVAVCRRVNRADHNIVYKKVADTMPGWVVCAVPCAIVKASWAELCMNLRKGAHIQFI